MRQTESFLKKKKKVIFDHLFLNNAIKPKLVKTVFLKHAFYKTSCEEHTILINSNLKCMFLKVDFYVNRIIILQAVFDLTLICLLHLNKYFKVKQSC